MKKILSLLLLIIFCLPSCEKDDVCDGNTPTTPRLVIDFYNFKNPSAKKQVNNLKVIGDGMKDGIIFNNGAKDEEKFLTNSVRISIPLKTDSNTTKFKFILNSNNSNSELIDTDEITFNYTRNEVYVSRACGFKTLFILDNNPINHVAIPNTKTKWMQQISIEKTNIDNENEVHIKVFF